MATQSTARAEDNSPNADLVQSRNEDQQDEKEEAAKAISTPSVFVNTEPMREEQVENAVKFLSHPKVQGSPVIYRRSFLEKKGLTKEEIDEAFRRVPDPTPTVPSVQTDGQLKSSLSAQSQAPTQNLQPAAAAPVVSPVRTSRMPRFHWSHAFIAIGLLAGSGAGMAVLFKNIVVPRLKSWIRWVVLEEENELLNETSSKPRLAEEAAAAATDVAKASQDMLNFKNEERRCFEELRNLLDVQVQEMKSVSNAIQHLEGQGNISGRSFLAEHDRRVSVTNSKHPQVNGKIDHDARSVRSSSPPVSVESTVASHPKSYADIMAMVRRGEKPSNIKEINDLPPNPNQPFPNPSLATIPKPWEVDWAQTTSSHVLRSQGSSESLNGDGSAPWLQHKNVRIREIETEDEVKTGSYNTPPYEQPIQRSWVPPQPPPVAIPEAAAAIRQPKSSVRKEQSIEDQLGAPQPSDETDELQRITKISESGGVEINGRNSSEIQEEE